MLKPHTDKVRKIDQQMNRLRGELSGLEESLVDESLYTDTNRQAEMTELLQKQASIRSNLESLEWEWLEASEVLEKAENELN